ncbi:MAG TPA: AzlD domain-containing protein [candidate division Zixibacteria bacterium]|nr:AzlD domain-containing protein [candidate division Zixibacteria bacterium]
MDRTGVILIMGLMAYALRVVPQVLLVGRRFPEGWDRWLRCLSYALICSIVAMTLFMTGGRFESNAAPRRVAALAAAALVAHRTQSPVAGMMAGTALAAVLGWLG